MRIIDADALIADMSERYCKPCKANGEDHHEVRCRVCWVDDAIDDIDDFGDNAIEPKQGEWIFHYRDKWMVKAECPKCHLRFQFPPRTIWKCCPMCETRMKGADGKK